MHCRHAKGLAARWDYLSQDLTCATGWIICSSCKTQLQRVTIAGGTFRGQGPYLDVFREQVSREAAVSLTDLEID